MGEGHRYDVGLYGVVRDLDALHIRGQNEFSTVDQHWWTVCTGTHWKKIFNNNVPEGIIFQ